MLVVNPEHRSMVALRRRGGGLYSLASIKEIGRVAMSQGAELWEIHLGWAGLFGTIAGACCYFLLAAPFPDWLIPLYITYVITSVLLIHSLIYALANWLRDRKCNGREKLPKFVEYLYTVIVSASLVQIFFMGPRIADYLAYMSTDEPTLIHEIQVVAQEQVQSVCGLASPKQLAQYCKNVGAIAEGRDVKDFLRATPLQGTDWGYTYWVEQIKKSFWYKQPELLNLLRRLSIIEDYTLAPLKSKAAGAFAWIGMLLLPIGIALRLGKTTIELFPVK